MSGGGGNTDNSALQYQANQDAKARADEEDRKRRIAQGREQIDALFDRGQTLVTPGGQGRMIDDPDPSHRQSWMAGPPQIADNTAPVWSAPGTQPAFDQNFYNQRKQAYIDNYTPQLAQQFSDARNQLSFALARAGLLRSSVASDKVARLDSDNAVQAATIGNKAEDSVAQLRSGVEDQRSNLITQLNASADPAGAANLALARTQSIASQPVSYSPLGDVFSGIAGGIGNFVQGVRQRNILNSFNTALDARNPTGTGTGTSGQGTSVVGA